MSYYHGLISSRTASIRLEKAHGDGCFLIRDSQSQPGNFVLSVRYKKNVYHILIFNQDGEYYLDSSENDDKPADKFSSLEDLVLFGMSHELRVAGEEVILYDPVLCTNASGHSMQVTVLNGQRKKQDDNEDSDLLTDIFASVFGAHCSVLVMIHSHLNFDGRPLPNDESYLGCVVKDNLQRGFFIRVVDPQSRNVLGEKKVTKNFEYDLPSELVLTFLSEHGITCLGFRDAEEKSMFTRHVDRIIQLQQDRKVKVHKHPSSSPERDPNTVPAGTRQHLKAEEFDINDISPEWQYIFEQAGVTNELLKNKKVLQFLLDKIYEMGGAPQKIEEKQSLESNNSRDERTAAIQMDAALRQESIRASRLADELRKTPHMEVPQPMPRRLILPSCSYSGVCTRYKELLMERSTLTGLSPIKIHCYCNICAAGKPLLAVSGSPPHQYTLPVGWCQFILRSQTHSLSQQFCSNWHVAFCPVPASYVANVVRTGRLMHSSNGGNALLSPDIRWAKSIGNTTPELYHDDVERKDFKISTVFQVFVQPGSYKIERQDLTSLQPLQQMWQAPEKTYIPYALLLQLHPMSK